MVLLTVVNANCNQKLYISIEGCPEFELYDPLTHEPETHSQPLNDHIHLAAIRSLFINIDLQ